MTETAITPSAGPVPAEVSSKEAEPSESNVDEGDPMLEVFIRVALRGAKELRDHLGLDETNFVRVSGQTHPDAPLLKKKVDALATSNAPRLVRDVS